MFKIRSLRRTQTAYILIFAKLAFAVVISYIIAHLSLAILRKLNDLSSGDDAEEDDFLAKWNNKAHGGPIKGLGGKPFATILFWTKWFDEKPPLLDFTVKRCLPSTCHVTADRATLKHADAVVFHSRDLDLHDLPPTRTPEQLWIFLTLESPFFSGIQIPIWRNISAYPGGMFNWTATYRRDSDVYCPYGAIRRVAEEDSLSKREPFFELGYKNKSRRILWFAGNCHTMSNRELFVDRLKKLYPIDIFGPCGTEQDEPPQEDDAGGGVEAVQQDFKRFKHCHTRKNELDCWRTLAQRYKYYLALENSFCRDYITEKFYRPMYYGLLPIVAGGRGTEDYKAIAPEKSFISAFDYNSAKEIAAVLRRLDNNLTLYNSYFQWRRSHTVEFKNPLCACEICNRLIKEIRRRHAMTLNANNRVMTLDDDDENGDPDDRIEHKKNKNRALSIMSSNRIPFVAQSSASKSPTGTEVSRWWHDGACVVP